MRLLSIKNLYRLHAYGGLWLGAHFLLFVTTGFILLFKPAPEYGRFPVPTEGLATPAKQAEILRSALAEYPGERPLSLFPDDESPGVLHLRLDQEGRGKFRGARKLDYDLVTGRALTRPAATDTGFFARVLKLHRELFAGSTGKILVGISGLLLLLISLSGFFIYARFRKGQAYDSFRFGSRPLLLADIHKWLGAAAGTWILLVTFTGTVLAFNSLLIKFYQYRNLADLSAVYGTGRVEFDPRLADRVISNALAARPGAALDFLAFPGTEFSLPGHYLLLLKSAGSFGGHTHAIAVVDALTAEVSEVRELPLYLKTLLLSEPLHFGDYGGLTLKVLWGAFCLVSMGLTVMGIWAWFAKRAARRVPPAARRTRHLPIVRARRSAWWAPALFGLFTLSGAGLALLAGGLGDVPAYFLFGLPLAALLRSGTRRWREERARHE